MMHVHMTSGTANVGEALQMFLQGGSRVLLMIAMALFLAYMIFFLATSRCTQGKKAVPCTSSGTGPTEVPWAVRSGNRNDLAEVPLDYIDSNDVYLIYSDLFYDLVGSDAPAVKQAAVRLEDVGPESDPKDLRRVADYLASENVPFQVAVIPIQIGQNKDGSDWYGLSLTDRPEVVDEWKDRLDAGRSVMEDAGLGEPTIFETPHYGGSVNSYVAMAQEYNARYEQGDYYASILTGQPSKAGKSYSQQFPFTVSDIYGGAVYPENLGNITEGEQNKHAARTPEFLVSRANANLTVRESTASFFFHPYLDIEYLKKTVTGIKRLGYEFRPVTELK